MSTNEESHDELISQFCSITSCDPERGQFYLESANWNLQLAIQSFFEHSDDMSSPSLQPRMPARNPTNISDLLANVNEDSSDTEMTNEDIPPQQPSQPQPPPLKSSENKKKPSQPQQSSRFATLDTLRAQQDSGASSDEEGQAFYAGGSVRSGQQVLGPPRKQNTSDFVSDMFKSAKEHGAEIVDPNEERKQKNLPAFAGLGFKLNSPTSSNTNALPNASAMKDEDMDDKEVVLKLWKNGFSIDDGPLRTYDNPENQEFLTFIRRGEIPRELTNDARGRQIDLNMEDHKNEEFVAPKRKVQAFSGEAHRLGSPAAEFITSAIQRTDPNDLKKCEQDAQNDLKLDDTQPQTNIQIRLSDGSRLALKINLFRTIADIRQYICTARPAYGATPFVLMTTFPNKDLTDETLTIKDANLLNALIVQRII